MRDKAFAPFSMGRTLRCCDRQITALPAMVLSHFKAALMPRAAFAVLASLAARADWQ